jgi:hypothetical protein
LFLAIQALYLAIRQCSAKGRSIGGPHRTVTLPEDCLPAAAPGGNGAKQVRNSILLSFTSILVIVLIFQGHPYSHAYIRILMKLQGSSTLPE